MAKVAKEYEVRGDKLVGPVCSHERFWTTTSLLSSRWRTLFNLDWADRGATNVVCERCGHILWFSRRRRTQDRCDRGGVPLQAMTDDEVRAFLLGRPRTGTLASMRPDGRPHAAPVWFDLDGERVIFTTWHASVKAANLRREPRVAFCVDDQEPPFAVVAIEGTVEVEEAAPDLRRWAARIAARYMGEERAEAFGARNGVPGEWLVRITPTTTVARRAVVD